MLTWTYKENTIYTYYYNVYTHYINTYQQGS